MSHVLNVGLMTKEQNAGRFSFTEQRRRTSRWRHFELCEEPAEHRPHVPVVPAGQLVQTTSLVFGMTAQVAPAGQGQGWQSPDEPLVASP